MSYITSSLVKRFIMNILKLNLPSHSASVLPCTHKGANIMELFKKALNHLRNSVKYKHSSGIHMKGPIF